MQMFDYIIGFIFEELTFSLNEMDRAGHCPKVLGEGWFFLPHPSSPARRGSTTPPKYYGFAEVLHARQCSNAFVIGRVRGQVPEPSYKMGLFYLTRPLLLGDFRKLPRPLLPWRGAPPLSPKSSPSSGGKGLKAWPAGPVRANKLSP